MKEYLTEDEVRDKARNILNFYDNDLAVSGVGQLTTFKQLGFDSNRKPDGWYLPFIKTDVAILLEAKNSDEDLDKESWIDEIKKNCTVIQSKYDKIIGILYNGYDIRVYKNNIQIETSTELEDKHFYINLYTEQQIDKEKIYNLTAKINECLHSEFGIKNLYHRMIFTACALVATRYGALLVPGMDYATFHTSILSTLNKSLEDDIKQNKKLGLLVEVYSEIKMNITENQDAINNFIQWVKEISSLISSDHWNGEDVMGIFFNEFNRYKKKSESGQVFTPDHITSLMYRLIEVNQNDYVLDAACGSGAFLVKAMSNMMKQAGGYNTSKAKDIRMNHLYGIEFDREIYALACANMLIHKDGKTNLEQMDTRSQSACSWMASKPITKVLMNPPFENRYGCLPIVFNVLDSVKQHTLCAFIMPDKKLEASLKGLVKEILKKHRLLKIIKLPEKTFEKGTKTSIFIFEAGVPQNNEEIFGCYIAEDGLETVKNKGRHDIKNKWQQIEDYWVNVIKKQSGDDSVQWIKPKEHLSYQMPKTPFIVRESDFNKDIADAFIFEKQIDIKELKEQLANHLLYNSEIQSNNEDLTVILKDEEESPIDVNNNKWGKYKIKELFEIHPTNAYKLTNAKLYDGGTNPVIVNSAYNNGVGGYTSKETTEKGNMITFSDTVNANTIFYQKNDFVGYPHVQGLYPIGKYKKMWNEKTLRFFVSVFRATAIKEGFDFNNKFRRDIASELEIYLPIQENGEPDWLYMEEYITSMIDKNKEHLDNLCSIGKGDE